MAGSKTVAIHIISVYLSSLGFSIVSLLQTLTITQGVYINCCCIRACVHATLFWSTVGWHRVKIKKILILILKPFSNFGKLKNQTQKDPLNVQKCFFCCKSTFSKNNLTAKPLVWLTTFQCQCIPETKTQLLGVSENQNKSLKDPPKRCFFGIFRIFQFCLNDQLLKLD